MVEQRNQADHGCGRYSKRSIVAGSIPALGSRGNGKDASHYLYAGVVQW